MRNIIILLFLFTSCKKVITPNLNDTTPQLVIEGAVSDTAGPYYINISRTVNFYSDNIYPDVSGAVVTITDKEVTDTLTETTPGIYVTHKIQGTPGDTYALHVLLDGKTYTASSTMPFPVALDSVTIDYGDLTQIRPIAYYRDPLNARNYYKYNMRRNGADMKRFQTFDDLLSNGRYISDKMDTDTGEIRNNDHIEVFLVNVDQPAYNFFKEAEDVAYNNDNLAAPATPTSNITGGCIGYFSAQTVSHKPAVVKY